MLKIETSSQKWGKFVDQIEKFLEADTIELLIHNLPVKGYRSPDSPALWIRDHSDIMRGGVFFEEDMKSTVECFALHQALNGAIFDNVSTKGTPTNRENWDTWIRVPVEADVEYRFVKAGYLAWQATGDTKWMKRLLPNFEMALTYTLLHPWRWDEEHQLVKRAYTIDTWDFDYTAGKQPWLNFQISEDTFWGIFHGDNSGFYESCLLLSKMLKAVGAKKKARQWKKLAKGVRKRANQILFNGKFYTHFHKLVPVTIEGVDEAQQLSMSNPMAINRGMTTPEISQAILNEYQSRKKTTGAFAPWFGIEPAFPDGVFGDSKLIAGAYINGGIFPLCGGELARAAFVSGEEAFGLETLEAYNELIASSGETYLWYFPNGEAATEETSTSPESQPTDGWGSTAMLYGFIEGLCGIVDKGISFQTVDCAPRWVCAKENYANIEVSYKASGASFGYTYQHEEDKNRIELHLKGTPKKVNFQVLLPEHVTEISVKNKEAKVPATLTFVGKSPYAVFKLKNPTTDAICIEYKKA